MSKRKLKPILPSLKERKRYLAFSVLSGNGKFDAQVISDVVDDAILGYIGALGKGEAGAWMLKDCWDVEKQAGIIRVGHRHSDEIKAALCLVSSVGGSEVAFRSLGLSGILRKAKKYTEDPRKGVKGGI